MSHALRRADGVRRMLDREGNDMVKPIPLYRITIYPKNKYSQGYKDTLSMVEKDKEKKVDNNS
jgi:hypothetical protein